MSALFKDKYNKKLTSPLNIRLNVVLTLFFCLFGLIVYRLAVIQLINRDKYKSLAYSQYLDSEIIRPTRGSILSVDGYTLAGVQTSYLMYAEPQNIPDRYKFINDMSKLLTDLDIRESTESSKSIEYDKNELFSKKYNQLSGILDPKVMWYPLKRSVSPQLRNELTDLQLPGIGFEEEPLRYYPEGSVASHVIGFVGSDENGDKLGYFGVEGFMNEDLKGKPGRVFQEVDAMGRPILLGEFKKLPPVQGRNIVLTIDRAIQYMVEKKLSVGVEKYDAVSGSVVVMSPSTGDIIALANYPSYDPNNVVFDDEPAEGDSEVDPGNADADEPTKRKKSELRNFSISRAYEPGSVMKPLTISAALDLKIITPETSYVDSGPVVYSGKVVDNWDHKHLGDMDITLLLQKSNNIGAAWVGHQVGAKNLYKYFDEFNVGSMYGIEMEGEEMGNLRDYKTWTDIDLANISFGQGMSATPLQVLNAFNVFANGGYLLQPKIISRITDDKNVTEIPTKNIKRVLSKKTADTMVYLLEKAAEGGEAKFFFKKDYRVAGKTGTAEISTNIGYDSNKTNATFVGFLVTSRKFSMIVKLEEPKTSVYASETATPLWIEIADEIARHYGIPPDEPKAE